MNYGRREENWDVWSISDTCYACFHGQSRDYLSVESRTDVSIVSKRQLVERDVK